MDKNQESAIKIVWIVPISISQWNTLFWEYPEILIALRREKIRKWSLLNGQNYFLTFGKI